jgi:hypothetical protein
MAHNLIIFLEQDIYLHCTKKRKFSTFSGVGKTSEREQKKKFFSSLHRKTCRVGVFLSFNGIFRPALNEKLKICRNFELCKWKEGRKEKLFTASELRNQNLNYCRYISAHVRM